MRLLLCFAIIGVLSSCSRVGSSDSDTTTVAELISATSMIGPLVQSMSVYRSERDVYATCSSLSFGACDSTNYTKTLYYSPSALDGNGCTRGSGANLQTLFGAVTSTYNSADCSESNGTTVTRSFVNHYLMNANGDDVLMYSNVGTVAGVDLAVADLTDYGGVVRRGGATMLRSAGTDILMIPGIHRRGYSAAGRFTFWHTLYTTNPLNIQRNGANSTIFAGQVMLAQNRGEYLLTQTMINTVFQTSCNYPVSGAITYTTTSATAPTTSFTVNFLPTCGSVTVDGSPTTLAGG